MPKGTQAVTGSNTSGEKKKENTGDAAKSLVKAPDSKKETSGQEPTNIAVPKPVKTSPPSPQQSQPSVDSSPQAPPAPKEVDRAKIQAREELLRRLAELDAQRRELELQMQALREQQTDLDEERTDLPKERAEVKEQSPEAEEERKELDSREEALNEREADLDKQKTELDAAKQKLTDDRTALEAERQRLADDRTAFDAAQQRLTDDRTALDAERHQVETDQAALNRGRASVHAQAATIVANERSRQTRQNLANLERDLTDPVSRPRVLRSKFVDDYRGQKEQERRELERALAGGHAPAVPGGPPNLARVPVPAAGAAPAQQEKGGITAEDANEFASGLSSAGGLLSAGWSMVDGFLDTDDKLKDNMTQIDRFANNGFALGTSALSGAQNITQFAVNRKKRNATKDKAKKANLTWDSIGNVLSLTGNLAKGTGGIIGLSTDLKERQKALDEKNKNKKDGEKKEQDDVLNTSSWMTGISSVFSFMGSASKFIGNTWGVLSNKYYAKKLDKERVKDNNNRTEAEMKSDLANVLTGAGGDKTSDDYQRNRKLYKSFKARKYGMEQMRQFRENKGKRVPKGIVSLLGSAVSSVSSLATVISKDYKESTWGKRLRGFLPIIGTVVNKIDKKIGEKSDKNLAEESERIKLSEIDKYLQKKRSRVIADANNKLGQPVNLGANEIDRITLGRLGVDITIVNDPISKEDKLKAFEELNLKRAKQIMEADDTEDILSTMGLNKDASLEEVAAALKGE